MKLRRPAALRQEVQMFFGATSISTYQPKRAKQLPFGSIDADSRPVNFLRFTGKESEIKRNAQQLRESSVSTTPEPSSMVVLLALVTAIESLQLLEAIYGYTADKSCKLVGIANELSDEQRDLIWDINWEFKGRYPHVDIEVLLIQRHNRPLHELYNGDSAIIKRVPTAA